MTNLAFQPSATDKSDKTSEVSNETFLAELFSKLPNGVCPMVVSIAGKPDAAAFKKHGRGQSWHSDAVLLPSTANNYFSLSAYRPNDAGEYRRQKGHFHGLFALMLDVVGTKVPHDRLTLQPSWLLETSEGNYQAGYMLAQPITDANPADKVMKAIIAAGLCDPGAGGPTARLARLPVAINGKTDPAFQCKLEQWNPDNRYTVEQIVEGLQLEMNAANRSAKGNGQATTLGADREIYTPRPTDNPVITTLKKKGLYKTDLGGQKHDITCPWVAEHTDQQDGGTAYYEPDTTYPLGGFSCLHGHCVKRKISSLLEWLNIEPSQARMKPTIRIMPGQLHTIADKAEEELALTKHYYQRGGFVVIVMTDPNTREICIKPMTPPALTGALSAAIHWEGYDGRAQCYMPRDPSARIVSMVYDATSYAHLPSLNGIAHQPYLREDGTLVTQSGYDSESGMYGVFNPAEFSIPQTPTKQQAQAAFETIAALLDEFAFADASDKAAALAAILTAAIRPSLPLAPMFHVRAPQISSGKSYLCQVISAFASARHGAPVAFPSEEEECRKLLLSELLRAPAVIEFDNLTSELIAHKSLCTALTSEYLSDRILGVSKTATVSTRSLFLSSGNNVGPIQDMVRRCITINLDPGCETPAARTFKNPNVLGDVQANRAEYVSAALTIIMAWQHSGEQPIACKPLNSFDKWTHYCRQPLLWMGYEDPTASVFKAISDDPDTELLGRLLHAWHSCYGDTPMMLRQALDAYNQPSDELLEVFADIAGERDHINRKRLGHYIKRQQRRIVSGLRFLRAEGTFSAAAWKVEAVE